MKRKEFPHESLIKLTNDPHFLGRVTINKLASTYSAEIDIVHAESRKIYKHIDILYNQPSEDEATKLAVSKLSRFLNSK